MLFKEIIVFSTENYAKEAQIKNATLLNLKAGGAYKHQWNLVCSYKQFSTAFMFV
jgi:hypothetical protein